MFITVSTHRERCQLPAHSSDRKDSIGTYVKYKSLRASAICYVTSAIKRTNERTNERDRGSRAPRRYAISKNSICDVDGHVRTTRLVPPLAFPLSRTRERHQVSLPDIFIASRGNPKSSGLYSTSAYNLITTKRHKRKNMPSRISSREAWNAEDFVHEERDHQRNDMRIYARTITTVSVALEAIRGVDR